MKKAGKKSVLLGVTMLAVFILWTIAVQHIDVRPVGVNGTNIGFARINIWFHELTGVHMSVYTVTDWLGLVPFVVCLGFGVLGLTQLIKRRSFLKVDKDIIALGIYYILVIGCYVLFEIIPINYRPILIEGVMEASYPSSTTLVVMGVMPTLIWQLMRRMHKNIVRNVLLVLGVLYSVYMIIGRMTCGVHWLTDILGAAFFSTGLFLAYRGSVLLMDDKGSNRVSNEA